MARNCSASRRPLTGCPPDRRGAMSCAAPMPTPGRSWRRSPGRSVPSSQRATITGSFDGSSASACCRRARPRSPPPAVRGSRGLEQARSSAGPSAVDRSAPGGRARDRRMTALDEAPRPVDPRRRRRVDADPRRGDPPRRVGSSSGAVSSRSGEAGSHRSTPVQPVSRPKAAATSPGPLASRSRGMRSIRSAAASARSPVTLRRRAVDRTMRSTRIASMPSSGSIARTSTAAGAPSGSVTTLRQSYIP